MALCTGATPNHSRALRCSSMARDEQSVRRRLCTSQRAVRRALHNVRRGSERVGWSGSLLASTDDTRTKWSRSFSWSMQIVVHAVRFRLTRIARDSANGERVGPARMSFSRRKMATAFRSQHSSFQRRFAPDTSERCAALSGTCVLERAFLRGGLRCCSRA